MKGPSRLLPVLAVVASLGWLGSRVSSPGDSVGEMKVREFGRLPLVYQGRVKPFDTLARNSLLIISDRQTFVDDDGNRQPAIKWLLDVISHSPAAGDHKVFRIENLQLQAALGLEPRKRYRYAWNEFFEKLGDVDPQIAEAARKDQAERDLFDVKLLEFSSKTQHYSLLAEAHSVPRIDLDSQNAHLQFAHAKERFHMLDRQGLVHSIPPLAAGQQWRSFIGAVFEAFVTPDPNPALRPLAGMLQARREGDAAAFNSELARYQVLLATSRPADPDVLSFEVMFNHLEPFYRCSVLYVIAFLIGCIAWMGWSEVLNRTAFWLMVCIFGVHTAAIAARIYISGYPPITNLYGTAVFIGWGCVGLGLILETIYRFGIGNLLASVAGFLTLLIAHFLAGDGDTLIMMQAVLDTKFWLATHVVVINFGYAATFFAGLLGILFIFRGVFTRALSHQMEKTFGRMLYGVVCFAMLLSFVGTVLGGLWADDSWGRFWGWDPKENGALMIVLWNALILHARWGGMIKTRGFAVLAVFGTIVTAWSWFGVNQLGVGLHSYGFTDSTTTWLVAFVVSQLFIIVVGLTPKKLWRSVRATERAFGELQD